MSLLVALVLSLVAHAEPSSKLLAGTVLRLQRPVPFATGAWNSYFVDGKVEHARDVFAGSKIGCTIQLRGPAPAGTAITGDLVVEKVTSVGASYVSFRFGGDSPVEMMMCHGTPALPSVAELRACLGPTVALDAKLEPEPVAAPAVEVAPVPMSRALCKVRERVLRDEYAARVKEYAAAREKLAALAKLVRERHVEPALEDLGALLAVVSPADRALLARLARDRAENRSPSIDADAREALGLRLDAALAVASPRVARYMCKDDTKTYAAAPGCWLTRIRRASYNAVSLVVPEPYYRVSLCDSVYFDVNLYERFSFCATVDFVGGELPTADELVERVLARSPEAKALKAEDPGTLEAYLSASLPIGCRASRAKASCP